MAYRYESFDPGPRYENRFAGQIGATLRDMGTQKANTALALANINAQETANRGRIWGQTIEQLGDIAGNLPMQLNQAAQIEETSKLREMQNRRLTAQLQQEERAQATRDQVNSLLTDQTLYGKDGTINVQELHKRMSSALPAGDAGPVQPIDLRALYETVEPVNRSLVAARNDRTNREAATVKATGEMAAAVLKVGERTGSYVEAGTLGIGSLMRAGLVPEDVGTQMMVGLVEHPEVTKQRLEELVTLAGIQPAKRELQNVPPGNVVIDERTGQQVFQAPFAPTKGDTPTAGTLGDYLTHKYPGRPLASLTGQEMLAAKAEFEAAGRAPREPKDQTDVLNIQDTVAGMRAGTLPPLLPGRASKDYIALMAEAKRQGFDIAGAATDWMATQKHIATMNGAQQLRLNQAVNALPEMLDKVDDLAQQWNAGGFAPLNKVNLAAAKSGGYGTKWATVATQLDAQIADVVADLGNVYMGGNSPTDHALSLAGKSLSADWSEPVLRKMVDLAKQNVQIRRNSINNTGVAGASADNPYWQPPPPAPPPAAPMRKAIPGVEGGIAESTDGGRTWKRVQ